MRLTPVLGLVLLSAACGDTLLQTVPDSARRIEAPAATRAAFDSTVSAFAQYNGVADRRRLVIRDTAAWQALWAELSAPQHPAPPAPAVDFAEYMVVFAAAGPRTTGGHATAVDEVLADGPALFVRVTEVSPGAGCVTTQALTSPIAARLVPRRDGSVSWLERTRATDCGT
jgi:hypothetical protein